MKTALITGASSGIGKALAGEYAQGGYNLVLVARSADLLAELQAELQQKYARAVHVFAQDLTAPDGPQNVYSFTERLGIGVDALVNNAGYGDYGPFWERDRAKTLGMVALNITALTDLAHRYLPGMVARKSGHILNVASTASFLPGPLMTVYFATKHYVLALSEGLAYELRGTGVTVTALCPGPTTSGFQAGAQMEGARLLKTVKLMTPASVARFGYRSALRGRVVAIPGFFNWVTAVSPRLAPRGFIRKMVYGLNQRR